MGGGWVGGCERDTHPHAAGSDTESGCRSKPPAAQHSRHSTLASSSEQGQAAASKGARTRGAAAQPVLQLLQ